MTAILLVDLTQALFPGGADGATSVIDPLAHLATGVIVAVAIRPPARATVALLAASVLIDLDHVPAYLGWDVLTADSGRPYTHSLATVALLVAAAAVTSARWRAVALGSALGVALHLWRDLVTGPGVPLLWPLDGSGVRFSYLVYGAPLAVIAALAFLRAARSSRYSAW